jgi:hypothetical protein
MSLGNAVGPISKQKSTGFNPSIIERKKNSYMAPKQKPVPAWKLMIQVNQSSVHWPEIPTNPLTQSFIQQISTEYLLCITHYYVVGNHNEKNKNPYYHEASYIPMRKMDNNKQDK